VSADLRVLRLADTPAARGQIFRYPRGRAIGAAAAIVCAAVALAVLRWPNPVLASYVAGVLVLSLMILQTFVLARFRSSNWLVQANETGLHVRFRSYLNHRFAADDPTVVFIPYRAIRSARLVRGTRTIPDSDSPSGLTTKPARLVELELSGDVTPLAQALAAERARCGPDWRQHGGRSARYQHHPVRLLSPATLQLEWEVAPSRETLLDLLRPHATIEPEADRTQESLDDLKALTRDKQEARLRELAETGQDLAAITLTRRLYGYDLTQATAFVDSLRTGTASGARARKKS
jgi:hypothetical protein